MTHGWPGSVIELLETVGPLTDPTTHGGPPRDAFHLVLPSIPGYGFSGEPAESAGTRPRRARLGEADTRLGYTRYVAQGGDVGAFITDAMARQAPEGLSASTQTCSSRGWGSQQPAIAHEEKAATAAARRNSEGRLRLRLGAGHGPADDRLRRDGFALALAP